MRRIGLALLFVTFMVSVRSQETYPVNGAHDENHNFYAFTNAYIHIDYQTTIRGALLIQDGKVLAATEAVAIPKGCVEIDLKGKHIYPSLIDIYSDYGMPVVKKAARRSGPEQTISNKKGAFGWNEAIKGEMRAADHFTVNKKKAEELRKLGFGAVATHQMDGIVRGSSAFVTLGDGKDNEELLRFQVAGQYSFQKGVTQQNYPSSLMGSIALLRQSYYDAHWYAQQGSSTERNLSLSGFNALQSLPSIFEVRDHLSVFRADTVGDEFGVQYIFKGSGDGYKRAALIKATGGQLIVPLNFPKAYDVTDPYDALNVSLEKMKHWEFAPHNARLLDEAGIEFALTAKETDSKTFWKNLRKAIEMGLSKTTALKALTYTPAEMLGLEDEIGTLKQGTVANFIITDGRLFEKKTRIMENWIQGKRYMIIDVNKLDVRGTFDLNINGKVYELSVTGEAEKPKASVKTTDAKKKTKATIRQDDKLVTLSFEAKDEHFTGPVRLSGKLNRGAGLWDGHGQTPEGDWVLWSAIRKKKFEEEAKKDTVPPDTSLGPLWYPNMAYGWDTLPKAENLLIQNAKVWTCDTLGILERADILIVDGKVAAVGKGFTIPEGTKYRAMDANGTHITPGIIDEHSHIAISKGVNEGSQASSAEVSISRVVNSDDVNMYRQLAGGVTAAQLLHGSANPIGGQSGIIKFRWGGSPADMKIKDADGFIKFALGENVKQSNWGDNRKTRFPQTRMGVEQVYYDHFIRAREYWAEWQAYDSIQRAEAKRNRFRILPKNKIVTPPPRRDIELDAIAEILHSERFITCHSYIQSEINMLMHVADSMGFKVNTFTHILEGYKVADKMAAHGVGGSSFSDWWAYKFEVRDAIPYNGALMHSQGVVVAFNSDDAEMARRLNQEAAKAVKYGGVSEEDALKFVTINPAKLLHLDHRMGRINVGMDADLVIWNDHPLSMYARPKKTFIDGIPYFDEERDKQLRDAIKAERARLVKKMVKAKKSGADTKKPEWKKKPEWHCDDIGEEKWEDEEW